MTARADLHEIGNGAFIWHRHDPGVKADLFSTALRTAGGTYLIDPIQLPDEVLTAALGESIVAGIVVTNANHARAAAHFGTRFRLPVFAHQKAQPDLADIAVAALSEEDQALAGLEVIELEGGAPGEIALFSPADGGSLVVGDALINFGSSGFAFLPAKYCENPRLLRKSSRKLLRYDFERLLFAHGTPLLSGAHARLTKLLDENR